MSERKPRIVYACGCPGMDCIPGEEFYLFCGADSGQICDVCHQPVRAYNLDRLLRIEEKARKWNQAEDAIAGIDLGDRRYNDLACEAVTAIDELRDALAEPGEQKE